MKHGLTSSVWPGGMAHLVALAMVLLGMSVANVRAADDGAASEPDAMKPYTQTMEGTELQFQFAPIPGGVFKLGSPSDEEGRRDDEGPQVAVKVEPFWMMRHEVTWQQYKAFMAMYEKYPRFEKIVPPFEGAEADVVSYPTPLYDPSFTFKKGEEPRQPATTMTQFAARHFTKWLSMKTGRFYRLPTEAEWEYACRAGTTTAYHFGDDPADLDQYAWFFDNAFDDALGEEKPQPVGQLKPNPWGLYDMHGNVAELTLDQYVADRYQQLRALSVSPVSVVQAVVWPSVMYPRVARGGSFDNDPEDLRCARRFSTTEDWQMQDPQIPKSIWWFTESLHVGFRVIRPLHPPKTDQEKQRWWEPDLEEVAEVLKKQREGNR